MKESHVTYNMPTWIECYHKDNWQKRMKKYASHNDVEWYKFAIIRNEKYDNTDSFIAGFFKWKSDKLYIDRYLFRVESVYIDDVYAKSIEMYENLKINKYVIPGRSLEEEIWMGCSPYDVKSSEILQYKI